MPVAMLCPHTRSMEKFLIFTLSKQLNTCSESTSERTRPTPRYCTASTAFDTFRAMPKNAEFTSCKIFAVIAGSFATMAPMASTPASGDASASMIRK